MAKTQVTGSWHNSGYHGHFRSKSRTDFLCEYRHIAKPPPPKTFYRRQKERPAKHAFSHHDNRNSFMNDALYFEEGMGRRRIKNETNHYQPDLLQWVPEREEYKRAAPKVSVYRVDYHPIPVSDTNKQKIVRRPKTSFDDDRLSTTSYRYAHCNDNPNKPIINVSLNDKLSSTIKNRKQKASFISGRESVATCMSWYVAPRATPAATQTHITNNTSPTLIPHPPETQKPLSSTAPAAVTAPPVTENNISCL